MNVARLLALALFCALALRVDATCVARDDGPNPQQEVCARPPRGCRSQRRQSSCIKWHGCRFVPRGPRARRCKNDNRCAVDKPTRVPTLPPTCVTEAPTPHPTTRVLKCTEPLVGCPGLKTPGRCGAFRGCRWRKSKGQCGRNYALCPFRECSSASKLPASGECFGVKSKNGCAVFQCCKWNGKHCVSGEEPYNA